MLTWRSRGERLPCAASGGRGGLNLTLLARKAQVPSIFPQNDHMKIDDATDQSSSFRRPKRSRSVFNAKRPRAERVIYCAVASVNVRGKRDSVHYDVVCSTAEDR